MKAFAMSTYVHHKLNRLSSARRLTAYLRAHVTEDTFFVPCRKNGAMRANAGRHSIYGRLVPVTGGPLQGRGRYVYTYALVDGVEGLLLEGPVGVGLHDVVDVGEEQVAEEVGGLPRQLGGHIVDAAHQHTGTAETEITNNRS